MSWPLDSPAWSSWPSFGNLNLKEMNFWKQHCTRAGFEHLIVPENVWSKNIFILQCVSGKGAETKLYFKFTDPTNLESWLVFNREQNPFAGLDLTKEVPNSGYLEIAGSSAKTLSKSGINNLKK